jgi:hypothetical protein
MKTGGLDFRFLVLLLVYILSIYYSVKLLSNGGMFVMCSLYMSYLIYIENDFF